MSAAVAFSAMTHRPVSRGFGGDDYIDEPCSSAQAPRTFSGVSGSRQADNVTYANFAPATKTRLRLTRRGRRVVAVLVALPLLPSLSTGAETSRQLNPRPTRTAT